MAARRSTPDRVAALACCPGLSPHASVMTSPAVGTPSAVSRSRMNRALSPCRVVERPAAKAACRVRFSVRAFSLWSIAKSSTSAYVADSMLPSTCASVGAAVDQVRSGSRVALTPRALSPFTSAVATSRSGLSGEGCSARGSWVARPVMTTAWVNPSRTSCGFHVDG